jgi:hypothetical protein
MVNTGASSCAVLSGACLIEQMLRNSLAGSFVQNLGTEFHENQTNGLDAGTRSRTDGHGVDTGNFFTSLKALQNQSVNAL